ncbi:hypothetical protein EDD85DRAFT_1000172 [Armillaria nabsnona]|nr:hypothetical protein EDD85DRAFT_1000172 [Armillaria nabsnona]
MSFPLVASQWASDWTGLCDAVTQQFPFVLSRIYVPLVSSTTVRRSAFQEDTEPFSKVHSEASWQMPDQRDPKTLSFMDELVQKHTSKLSYQFPQSFASFLNTNELPKADVLAGLLKNVSDALQSVTSDIECLLNTYFQLQNIHHHLLQLNTECKKAMAPAVARLPPEMLMEDFRFSHAVCDHSDVLDLSWNPYVISHVCRLWRYIAIEKCPEIWADFWLEWNRWDILKDPVALLSLALSRSGNSPLEFLVEGAGGNDCQLVGGLSDETEPHWTTHEDRDDGVTEEIL